MTTWTKEDKGASQVLRFKSFFPHIISHVGNVTEFMDSDDVVHWLLSGPTALNSILTLMAFVPVFLVAEHTINSRDRIF